MEPSAVLLVSPARGKADDLSRYISSQIQFRLCGLIADFRHIPSLRQDVHILVVDLDAQGTKDETAWIRARIAFPMARLVVLFKQAHRRRLRLAALAGTLGYLHQETDQGQLIACLDEVLRGELVIPDADFLRRLVTPPADSLLQGSDKSFVRTKSTASPLTPGEREVLALLAEGLKAYP